MFTKHVFTKYVNKIYNSKILKIIRINVKFTKFILNLFSVWNPAHCIESRGAHNAPGTAQNSDFV